MEPVPAYLLVYFLMIRAHSGEPGYLVARMEGKDLDRVTDEVAMLRELRDLHFIGLSNHEENVVFDPIVKKVTPNLTVWRAGTEKGVPVPASFVTLARGRWFWTELVTRAVGWAASSAVGAAIGALATIWLAAALA